MPTVDDLQDPRTFRLLKVLPHDALVPEINSLLRHHTVVTTVYWALNFVCLALVIFVGYNSGNGLLVAFANTCFGMVLAYLLLIPVHEHLHAIAYRAIGCRNVSVSYTWRKMTAVCMADHEVVGGGPFCAVCLAPLVVINTALIACLALVPDGTLRTMLVGALLLHTGAASGDVALVSYFWSHRHLRLWTYDDMARAKSLIYVEVRSAV